jgi:hypothetical protein
MSIRYDRQYKQNVDIEGPIGPNTNEDQNNLSFLNNNDTYLGGGGGGGTFYSAPLNPSVNDLVYTPGLEVPQVDILIPTPENPTPNINVVSDPSINYELSITSNLQNEIGDFINLNYELISGGKTFSGNLNMADFNTDGLKSNKSILVNGILNIYLKNTLPANYSIKKIYYANLTVANKNATDYTKWNVGGDFIGVPAKELLTGGVAVAVIVEKVINSPKPTITLSTTNYTKQIKDSDLDTIINVDFKEINCDYIDFYLSSTKSIRVQSGRGNCELSFLNNFDGIYGNKKIIVVPYSDLYGTGDKVEITINFVAVNDFPSITEIQYTDSIDIPAFSDLNIEYNVKYSSFAASSIDVFLVLKDKTKVGIFEKLTPNGSFKINLKDLATRYSQWNGNDNVTLIFKPYNRSGVEELIGNEYEIKTSLTYPVLQVDEDIIKKSIVDAFLQNFHINEPEKESKHLTHLANFGNNEQIIISSWEKDDWTLSKKSTDELGNEIVKPDDIVESIILKLYSPLPTNINENSTFWITKLLTNPLVETVVLNEQNLLKCPPIKGPNFDIDVDFVKGKSTNYESLDDLILSASPSASTNLISKYLSGSLMNVEDLNIEYTSGSTYKWENFVHFSSAKERVDNFVYKVQLIEVYENLVQSAQIAAWSSSLASQQEQQKQTTKKEQLIQGFDGFEKFLYTSSSLSWPYTLNTRTNSSAGTVTTWYDNIIVLAENYDKENSNWIQNNIPQYIVNNTENSSLLLFFSMIGQHFDNIYFHTKSIEKSRSLGYKSKDGISDKLLFDTLKSFDWDAKNLDADSQLWKYAFGLNSDGNQQYKSYDSNGNLIKSNPARERTYEVWRRIINNLPYLLKHKGTRRGIYALMSCYGIPSSNLSILEFGGPEVTEVSKSKLVYDNVTTALKFTSGSLIEVGWGSTNNTSSLRPNTIEFFIKPYDNSNYTLISGSGWNVSLTGSNNSNFGQVVFNYNTTNSLTSSLLPIFNDNFFGISVSSGSAGLKLDIRQSNKEKTIFQESITASVISNWNSGSMISLGGNYSGSFDEFRLWSSQLDTERFYEHVSFPEMINGNDIFGSTDELHFRLDFEYPKNLGASNPTYLPNVDTNIYYPSIQLNPSSSLQLTRNILEETGSINFDAIKSENTFTIFSASARGFGSVTDYPHNFEAIDRSVVLEIPDLGSGRYSTNKIRFESQTLVSDLSSKNRATKKAFDQSPTDSNRVGLFFSPTKELNIDIAKSFGGINLDNYIGNPSDIYKSNYSELDSLRNYYFKRFDGRDIYAYINLIKLYEKSMFEDIKKMLPARVKATTGLLIEPHILERSKIVHKRPSADEYQQEVEIHYSDTTILTGDNQQYETIVDANLSENLFGENNQYEAQIYTASVEDIVAENYQYDAEIFTSSIENISGENYQYEVTALVGLDDPTIQAEVDGLNSNQLVGQSTYEEIGFGIYADNGTAIRTYFNTDNKIVKERILVNLVTEQKERIITKFAVTASANGLGDPRGGYIAGIQSYTETTLNIQPFSGSTAPTVKGNIISVKPVDGYLPTHYRNTGDLTTGLINSYYNGSKNTAATTLDGTPPIETFISNPNTLTVNKTGRSTNEPILEVE